MLFGIRIVVILLMGVDVTRKKILRTYGHKVRDIKLGGTWTTVTTRAFGPGTFNFMVNVAEESDGYRGDWFEVAAYYPDNPSTRVVLEQGNKNFWQISPSTKKFAVRSSSTIKFECYAGRRYGVDVYCYQKTYSLNCGY